MEEKKKERRNFGKISLETESSLPGLRAYWSVARNVARTTPHARHVTHDTITARARASIDIPGRRILKLRYHNPNLPSHDTTSYHIISHHTYHIITYHIKSHHSKTVQTFLEIQTWNALVAYMYQATPAPSRIAENCLIFWLTKKQISWYVDS